MLKKKSLRMSGKQKSNYLTNLENKACTNRISVIASDTRKYIKNN